MAAVVGLTLVKKFAYRGDATEEFSNQYWLTGAVPANSTDWKTLADALIVEERKLYSTDVQAIRAYGYGSDAEDAAAVWSYDYFAAGTSVPGTLTITGGALCSGDSAVWVRWKTNRLNTKGKPIYLRKYFHLAVAAGTAVPNNDLVLSSQKTALTAFGLKLYDGTFIAGRQLRSRSVNEYITGHLASTYITTRTLKRRGKRPGS